VKLLWMSVAILILSLCASAQEDISIARGFLDGNSYQELSFTAKVNYAMGIADGFLTAPMFGAPESNVDWLNNCMGKMMSNQLVAIFDQYVQANPAQWHYSMNMLSLMAMESACESYR